MSEVTEFILLDGRTAKKGETRRRGEKKAEEGK